MSRRIQCGHRSAQVVHTRQNHAFASRPIPQLAGKVSPCPTHKHAYELSSFPNNSNAGSGRGGRLIQLRSRGTREKSPLAVKGCVLHLKLRDLAGIAFAATVRLRPVVITVRDCRMSLAEELGVAPTLTAQPRLRTHDTEGPDHGPSCSGLRQGQLLENWKPTNEIHLLAIKNPRATIAQSICCHFQNQQILRLLIASPWAWSPRVPLRPVGERTSRPWLRPPEIATLEGNTTRRRIGPGGGMAKSASALVAISRRRAI